MHVTVFTQSCQKFFPSATILAIRHFHTTTPLIHFTKASSGSHKLTVKWISSVIVVFQCLFLSSIYPGNHCRSDPVQVQSTIPKVQNRLPKQINMICMYVFLLVPLWWQICAHRNKGQGQRAKNRGGRWKKDWEAHRRPSNMEEQQIKARRSSTYVGKARRSMKSWPQRMAAPTTVDNSITQPLNTKKVQRYPNGCAATDVVQCQCNTWDCQSKLVAASPSEK